MKPAHAYRTEISERAMTLARRRSAAIRQQARPVEPEPEEQWHPVKIAGVAVFAVALIYAIVTIGAVLA